MRIIEYIVVLWPKDHFGFVHWLSWYPVWKH